MGWCGEIRSSVVSPLVVAKCCECLYSYKSILTNRETHGNGGPKLYHAPCQTTDPNIFALLEGHGGLRTEEISISYPCG